MALDHHWLRFTRRFRIWQAAVHDLAERAELAFQVCEHRPERERFAPSRERHSPPTSDDERMGLLCLRVNHRRGRHVSTPAQSVGFLFQLNPALRVCERGLLTVTFVSHTVTR